MKKYLSIVLAGILCLSWSCAGCVQIAGTDSSMTDSISATQSSAASEESGTESPGDKASDSEMESGSSSGQETDTDHTTKKDTESKSESKAEKASQTLTADKTSVELRVGESVTVTVTASPDKDDKLSWESGDEGIAVVDGSGKITAVAEGKCIVTVRSGSDENAVQSIRVTVNPKPGSSSSTAPVVNTETTTITYLESEEGQEMMPQEDEPISKVESVTPSVDKISVALGQTAKLTATVSPLNVDSFELKWATSNDFIASVDESGVVTANEEGTCIVTVTSVSNPEAKAEIEVEVIKPVPKAQENEEELPKQELYIDGILIVNKSYSLPSDYNPGGLTAECSSAFEELRQGASADGIDIYLSSGFRSYETQTYLYNGYVYYYGQATADTFSARPGHSEHQTGLAIDCNIISDAFIGTPEAIWLEEHCHEYGFIIRYPRGKESITGYKYEPWHIRYIGAENAKMIHDSGLTLEEYFGISSVYDY